MLWRPGDLGTSIVVLPPCEGAQISSLQRASCRSFEKQTISQEVRCGCCASDLLWLLCFWVPWASLLSHLRLPARLWGGIATLLWLSQPLNGCEMKWKQFDVSRVIKMTCSRALCHEEKWPRLWIRRRQGWGPEESSSTDAWINTTGQSSLTGYQGLKNKSPNAPGAGHYEDESAPRWPLTISENRNGGPWPNSRGTRYQGAQLAGPSASVGVGDRTQKVYKFRCQNIEHTRAFSPSNLHLALSVVVVNVGNKPQEEKGTYTFLNRNHILCSHCDAVLADASRYLPCSSPLFRYSSCQTYC